ncbi:MAG: RagB/SusD family nutrient uptake outer membrane protein [Bacteroidales bacterium]|nr:MAG: RagB/SusD family nutrient uptake outer membrane protein [Bacteroidales bacterium]
MRKIFIIILLSGLFSCEKVFHESDSDLSDLSHKNSMEEALNGMYNRLARLAQGFYYTQIVNGDDITYIYYSNRISFSCTNIYAVDDEGRFIFSTGLDPNPELSWKYTYEEKLLLIWQYIYNTIISANNIIDQYETGELENRLYACAGEAYFVRAYCYFKLVRLFGKGPLVTGVDVDYTLRCSGPEDIYRVIENDLMMAVKILPENTNGSRIMYVTPHRGTAKALLAEAYLFMAGYPLKDDSKYIQAARFAGEVIDSAGFFGYGLIADYEEVWSRLNNYNEESVFSLFYDQVYDLDYDWPSQYSTTETLWLNWDEWKTMIVEVNFYNGFPRSYRRDVTFMNRLRGYHYELDYDAMFDPEWDPSKGLPIIDSVFFDHYYDTIGFGDNISFLKHYIQEDFPLGQNSCYKVINCKENVNDKNTSLYIFRYPHVLLTYAEAKARSGQLDASAYEALNMVRRRANKVDVFSFSEYDLRPGLSTEQFADSVVQERAWEFCGEMEGRWFDLIRLEMVEKLPELRHPNEKSPPAYPVTREDYFLPVPEEAAVWF